VRWRSGKGRLKSMPLRQALRASLRKGNRFYVARCLDLPVLAQGETPDEAIASLEEAVAFHLEDEDLESLGIASSYEIRVDMEVEAANG
jgi:predicted RNase H-like HicB family nuclease